MAGTIIEALRRRLKGRRAGVRPGVTLVEVMIAMALITIGILAMVQAFGFIQKAIQASKNRTLASNLAQEKMQILKQKVYYQVLVTSAPAHNDLDFAPEVIYYDTGYFPPENITEAGLTYTRYTYIQVAKENSGHIEALAPNIPDTGMRLITVTVVWAQGGVKKKLTLRSLMANPDTVMSNAVFSGTIRDSVSMMPVEGALVNVAENMGWRDTSDSSGDYGINVSPGNFTLVASADGYYSQVRNVSISANQTEDQDFDLVKIATGSVSGAVWLRDHLVISQVVASTVMANGDNVEFIELFNPTTAPVDIGSNYSGNNYKLGYMGEPGASQDLPEFDLNYISTFVPSGGFYIVSSSPAFTAAGAYVTADAVYNASNQPPCSYVGTLLSCLHADKAGAVILKKPDGSVSDKVGWSNNDASKAAPDKEGTAISLSDGLVGGAQLVRMSRNCSLSENEGRAYDSDNNSANWFYFANITYKAYGSSAGAKKVYSGTPAAGAVVTASDGVSSSTQAWLTGWCPYSTFTLVNVATGTWTVLISSGIYGIQNDTVTIADAGSVYLFPSTATFLTSVMDTALITGRVIDAMGAPISPAIQVSPGAAGMPTTASTANGRYLLRVSTGLVDVTANPVSGGTPSYVTMSSNSIPVGLGEVHSGVDFVLYQGGRITGYITRDKINPLPGVAVAVFDVNNIARDQQVSGLDGRFTTMNLSTGTYRVEPAVGSHEMAIPSTHTVTLVTPGVTVFATTFTITGAMGYISGSVKAGGSPIKTGVLIVVTTATLSGTPPAPPTLNSSTLAGTPLYVVSSLENGTFLAEVRNSTNPAYNVYAYYPSPTGTGASVAYSVVSGVQVSAGETKTGVNFSW